jgi:hypothetical protein
MRRAMSNLVVCRDGQQIVPPIDLVRTLIKINSTASAWVSALASRCVATSLRSPG